MPWGDDEVLQKNDSEATKLAKSVCSQAASKQGSGGASPPVAVPNVKSDCGQPMSHDYLQFGKPLQDDNCCHDAD